MNIAWIFTEDTFCGINYYAEAYCNELRRKGHCVTHLKVSEIKTIKDFSAWEIIHLQYELSSFCRYRWDALKTIRRKTKNKIIVTVHEVYPWYPFAFNRQNLKGWGLIKFFRKLKYDILHVQISRDRRFKKNAHFANAVVVHSEKQKKLFEEQSTVKKCISIPHAAWKSGENMTYKKNNVFIIGCTGFFSPVYRFDIVLNSLAQLQFPWKFIWIGGTRNSQQKQHLEKIKQSLPKSLRGKIVFTGNISYFQRNEYLHSLDCMVGMFQYKATSSAITTAIAYEIPCIINKNPLVDQLGFGVEIVRFVELNERELTEEIIRVKNSDRKMFLQKCQIAKNNLCLSRIVDKHLELYESV